MEQQPEKPIVKESAVKRFFRKRSMWIFILLIAIAYPFLQDQLYALMLVAFNGDQQAAGAYATWLPLGNPLSKMILALWVMALNTATCWLAMKAIQRPLSTWAKSCFKEEFKNLETKWKFIIFAAFWLVPQFVFALIFVGACLIA